MICDYKEDLLSALPYVLSCRVPLYSVHDCLSRSALLSLFRTGK